MFGLAGLGVGLAAGCFYCCGHITALIVGFVFSKCKKNGVATNVPMSRHAANQHCSQDDICQPIHVASDTGGGGGGGGSSSVSVLTLLLLLLIVGWVGIPVMVKVFRKVENFKLE